MRLPLFCVNAFPDRPVSGNPAAVCLLSSWLDERLLRKVAAENNLSATAFLVPVGNSYEIRWFTAVCELKLCGHATFAAGYVMLNFLRPELDAAIFTTRLNGNLSVRNDGELLAMDFPALFPKPASDVPARLFEGLEVSSKACQVLEVNETYFVVLEEQAAIQNLHPKTELLGELHPYAVSVSAPGESTDFVSRYFAPGYGIPEDPVTGSAHCALTPYWSKRLGKPRLHARQLSARGGELWCEMAGERVILRGKAVLTMRGSIEL
ncbi:MAG TPA: PhzF family phenazine biosynthesis protein [Candidatus Sulfotelmatobacter sp.]|nr:PhzF family phenazine biosynthesis protein [Candidatus Sulfotelmatobacter sp.]